MGHHDDLKCQIRELKERLAEQHYANRKLLERVARLETEHVMNDEQRDEIDDLLADDESVFDKDTQQHIDKRMSEQLVKMATLLGCAWTDVLQTVRNLETTDADLQQRMMAIKMADHLDSTARFLDCTWPLVLEAVRADRTELAETRKHLAERDRQLAGHAELLDCHVLELCDKIIALKAARNVATTNLKRTTVELERIQNLLNDGQIGEQLDYKSQRDQGRLELQTLRTALDETNGINAELEDQLAALRTHRDELSDVSDLALADRDKAVADRDEAWAQLRRLPYAERANVLAEDANVTATLNQAHTDIAKLVEQRDEARREIGRLAEQLSNQERSADARLADSHRKLIRSCEAAHVILDLAVAKL